MKKPKKVTAFRSRRVIDKVHVQGLNLSLGNDTLLPHFSPDVSLGNEGHVIGQ
jgi:hypothetical protein